MAENCKRKKDCWHYWRGECGVLESLVCEQRNCSFYETEEEYIKRQKAFKDKYDPIDPKNGAKY